MYYQEVSEIHPELQSLLEQFGLKAHSHVKAGKLSAGYRQKLEIVLSLLNSGKYVLLDEPFSNLDTASIQALYDYMEKTRQKGTSYLIVSHHDAILAQRADQKLTIG